MPDNVTWSKNAISEIEINSCRSMQQKLCGMRSVRTCLRTMIKKYGLRHNPTSTVNPDNLMSKGRLHRIIKFQKQFPLNLALQVPNTCIVRMIQKGIQPEEFSLEMQHWHTINILSWGVAADLFLLSESRDPFPLPPKWMKCKKCYW